MNIDLNSEIDSNLLKNYYKNINFIRPITKAKENLLWKKIFKWRILKDYICREKLGWDSDNVLTKISEIDAIKSLQIVTKEISSCHGLCVLVRHHLGLDRVGDTVLEDENDISAIERELERFVLQYSNDNVSNDNNINTCCVEDLFGCVLGETLNNIAFSNGNYSLVNKIVKVTNQDPSEITRSLQRLAICRALLPRSITKLIEPKTPLNKLYKSLQNTKYASIREWILSDYVPYFVCGDYLKTIELEANKAESHLIETYLPLVVSIAESCMHYGLSLLDLIQEGNIGLVQAIENHNKHAHFKTYATSLITQAITKAINDGTRSIRISVSLVEAVNRAHEMKLNFAWNYGRKPTLIEIAEELEIPLEEVKELILVSQLPTVLELSIGDKEGAFITSSSISEDILLELLSINRNNKLQIRESIYKVLTSLTPREQRVLQLRYGLEDGQSRTLEEVGQVFKRTRERIRQIQDKALRRLRHPSRSRKLKEYLYQ